MLPGGLVSVLILLPNLLWMLFPPRGQPEGGSGPEEKMQDIRSITLSLPYKLGAVNCYLVKTDTGFVLIDTGSSNRRTELESKKAMISPNMDSTPGFFQFQVTRRVPLASWQPGASYSAAICWRIPKNQLPIP